MMRFTDALVKTYEKYAHERASHSPDAFKVQERSEFLKFLKARRAERHSLKLGAVTVRMPSFSESQGFRVLAVDNTPAMVKLTAEKGMCLRKSWIAMISAKLTNAL